MIHLVGAFNCGDQALNPGESYTYLPDSDCPTMPAGFEGSAVASADQPIAAVVNVANRPVGAAAGQYTGTDGSAVSTSIAFPLVKSNHAGRTTTFFIQNASNSLNTISVEFKVPAALTIMPITTSQLTQWLLLTQPMLAFLWEPAMLAL